MTNTTVDVLSRNFAIREAMAAFDEIERHAVNPVIRQAAQCGADYLRRAAALEAKER